MLATKSWAKIAASNAVYEDKMTAYRDVYREPGFKT